MWKYHVNKLRVIVIGMFLSSSLWDIDKLLVWLFNYSFISEYTVPDFLLLVFNLKWTQ